MTKAGRLRRWSQAWVCLTVLGFQTGSAAAGEAPALSWPKSIDTPQGRCTVFQPQPAALDGDRLSARAALAVTPDDSTNVVFGIAELQARATPDPTGSQTTVSEMALVRTSFAPAHRLTMANLADTLGPELAKVTWTLASDELRTGLDAVEREQTAARGISSTPPRILYSSTPAALVVLDGPPQLRALTNSSLQRVVNTPYAMVYEPAGQRYWLQGSYEWFWAADWRGTWTPVAEPPAEVAAAVPKQTAAQAPRLGSLTSVSPRIVVATEPSELVVTRGEPAYTPVAGSDLLYVSNSDQLLLFTLDTKEFYVVFSGRWYRSPALTGPWQPVASDQLPPEFARITPGSPKSEALTYVAGTVEAQDAALQAAIPQITAVERGPADVGVTYEGTPQFQPVEDTGVQCATNTADAVFLVRGSYYVCRDAVWYVGSSPNGPWSVATSVPLEIQSLPPTHPHYNVKYVYVYGATPEEVYVGYLPGYSGCYLYGPTVVYGTGWWYPGYYGPSYGWAYPATYGFGFGYNSWCGWSVRMGFSYGWLSCGYGWGWAGGYPWGWWGPSGAYWACAPRYPCYDPHHPGRGGHRGRGDPHGPPPGGPPGGARSEVRRDAPGPADRPANPHRRTLPTYARTAQNPSSPPTTLRSARGPESRPFVSGGPNRLTQPSRPDAGIRRNAPSAGTDRTGGVASRAPDRPVLRSPANTTPKPGPRGAEAQPQSAPNHRTANGPTRPAVSPVQPSPAGQPGRVSAAPAPRTYAQTPTPSRSWSSPTPRAAPPPSRTPYASPPRASAPSPAWGPTHSATPSYSSGSANRAPSVRAPSMSGAAPMRSAPMRSSGGFSGGGASRGSPGRGR